MGVEPFNKTGELKTGSAIAIAVQTAGGATVSLLEIADQYRKTGNPTLMQIATLLYRCGHQIAHGLQILTDGVNNLRVDVDKAEKKERKETENQQAPYHHPDGAA